MAAFILRVGSRIHARVGMKKDGTLTAIQGTWYVDTGYYSFTTQAQVAIGSGELMIMAQCPNWDLKNIVVATNRNASGATRGFGGQELKCSFIPLLCLAMEKAGLDPFEVLKKNFVKPGGGYYWRDGELVQLPGGRFFKGHGQRRRNLRLEGEMERMAETDCRERRKTAGHRCGRSRKCRYRRGCVGGIRAARLQRHCHDLSLRGGARDRPEEQLCQDGCRSAPDPAGTYLHDACRFAGNPFEFGPVGSRGTYAIGSAVINAAEDAKTTDSLNWLRPSLALPLKTWIPPTASSL